MGCNLSAILFSAIIVCWVFQVCYQDLLYSDTFLSTLKNLVRHRKPATCLITLKAFMLSCQWLSFVWKPSHPSGCWLDGQYRNHGPVGCDQEVSWQLNQLKVSWIMSATASSWWFVDINLKSQSPSKLARQHTAEVKASKNNDQEWVRSSLTYARSFI